jgi:molecular chaperone DnaJ
LYVDISVQNHDVFSRNGDDLTCGLSVPLVDAVLGTSVQIETFDGELTVEIEPGSQSGEVVIIKGKGVKQLRSNHRGDLRVVLEVKIPTKLDGKQKDLFRNLAKLRKDEKPSLVRHTTGFFGRRK